MEDEREAVSCLLVSVRSAAESIAALEGGADLIDVKEPSRGSLGHSDDAVITAVLETVGGRKPVSAARGELADLHTSLLRQQGFLGLCYTKWGLAGCACIANWRQLLEAAAGRLPPHCRPVAVAYADWERAAAPMPTEVCAFACKSHWGAFLLDTWLKDGNTLLDFLATSDIGLLIERCHDAGVPVALAGSLGCQQIQMLLPLAPDWFAVRGAACREGQRNCKVDRERVRYLSDLLARSASERSFACASG